MRKIREVLRLKAEGFSDRQIAMAIGSACSTVQECIRRARAASLSWPLPPELDEPALHAQLYRRAVPLSRTPQPDFDALDNYRRVIAALDETTRVQEKIDAAVPAWPIQ